MIGGGVQGKEKGGYAHSVSFDATYIYDRTKPSIPSPHFTDNKIADKNLHTISRCLTMPLSILYPMVECLIHLRPRSQVRHLTHIHADSVEMLYLMYIDLLRVKSENIRISFRQEFNIYSSKVKLDNYITIKYNSRQFWWIVLKRTKIRKLLDPGSIFNQI